MNYEELRQFDLKIREEVMKPYIADEDKGQAKGSVMAKYFEDRDLPDMGAITYYLTANPSLIMSDVAFVIGIQLGYEIAREQAVKAVKECIDYHEDGGTLHDPTLEARLPWMNRDKEIIDPEPTHPVYTQEVHEQDEVADAAGSEDSTIYPLTHTDKMVEHMHNPIGEDE